MARRKTFTQEQVSEILKMYEEGAKLTEIANLFDTTNSHISYIANSNGLRRQTAHKFSKQGGGEELPQVSQKNRHKRSKILSFLCNRYSFNQRNCNRKALCNSQDGYASARKLQKRV